MKTTKQTLPTPNDNFFDILVKNHINDPNQFPLIDINHECISMFIAAIDNTGVMMGLVLYCLAKYRKESLLVENEIKEHISENFSYSDIQKLNYTTMFIKECLRMYSNLKNPTPPHRLF